MKFFNHLGAVSSPDTLITDIARIQCSKTLWDNLSNETLTLASADNFDMLQSHASVYHADQSRSFHAVTSQPKCGTTYSMQGFLEEHSEKSQRESLESQTIDIFLKHHLGLGVSEQEFKDLFAYSNQTIINQSN